MLLIGAFIFTCIAAHSFGKWLGELASAAMVGEIRAEIEERKR